MSRAFPWVSCCDKLVWSVAEALDRGVVGAVCCACGRIGFLIPVRYRNSFKSKESGGYGEFLLGTLLTLALSTSDFKIE